MTKEEFLAGKAFAYIKDITPHYAFFKSDTPGIVGSVHFLGNEHICNVEKVAEHYFIGYKSVLGCVFKKRFYFDKLYTL